MIFDICVCIGIILNAISIILISKDLRYSRSHLNLSDFKRSYELQQFLEKNFK